MTAPNPATLHQSLQPQLKLDAPLVDLSSGQMTQTWNRLFLYMWQCIGAGRIPQASSLQMNFTDAPIILIQDNTGKVVAQFSSNISSTGLPEQALAPGVSPFVYTPTTTGLLVVTGAQLELSRSGPFYVVSPMGGSLRMLIGDKARITWMTPNAPGVTWFPD